MLRFAQSFRPDTECPPETNAFPAGTFLLLYSAGFSSSAGLSSTTSKTASGAASAFDGNPATFFDPLGVGDGYCGMQFDEPYILEKVAILSRSGWLDRFAGACIEGSNNGEDWETIWESDEAAASETEYTVITDLFTLPVISAYQLKRPLRLVRNAHRALSTDYVGIKVILSVLFNNIRRKQQIVCPFGSIRLSVFSVSGPEAVAVALPVVEVVHVSRPYLQLPVAELLACRSVMRAVKINSVSKHSRFSIGDIFPKR